MKTIKKTTPTRVISYSRAKCEMTTYLLQSKDTGERIVVMKWLDNDDLELRHIKGDGRIVYPKPELQVFAQVTIPNGTPEDAQNFIEVVLSETV